MSDIYTYEPQDLDLKESIKLRTDCSQLDTITLQFNIYNYDIAVDLSNFNIEFRGIKPDGTLYSQAENITKVGNLLTIYCGNELTSVIGKTTCEVRIYDNIGNQKSSYFIVINVSGLVSDSDRIVSRTLIDSVEHLDNSINRAIQINQNFDNDIDEANTVSDTLATTTINANTLNSSLETKNNTASTNITNLTTQNTNATTNISTLTTKNSEALDNISDLTTQNDNASTNLANFQAIDTNNIVATLEATSNKIGDLNDLPTTDKSSIVNSIIEVNADLSENTQQISNLTNTKANNTDNARTTNDKTVTGSINELNANKANQSALDSTNVNVASNNSRITAQENKKISQTDITPELLAQIAGTTAINATPSDYSLEERKFKFPIIKGIASKNLFNLADITVSNYIKYTTGVLTSSANYTSSNFIPITPSTDYKISGTNEQGAFFDANKVYISGFTTALTVTTTPSNAYYIRLSMLNSQLTSVQLEQGMSATTYESYSAKVDYTLIKEGSIKNINIGEEEITSDKLDFIPIEGEKSKNLFNKDTVYSGHYANAINGNLGINSNHSVSDYIPVLTSTQYTLSGTTEQLAFYDSGKVFVSGITTPSTFTTPSTTTFVKISMLNTQINSVQLEKSSIPTTYVPFGNVIKANQINQDLADLMLSMSELKTITITKTVKPDGTGDYLSPKLANDAISDASVNKIYDIIVYPGIYTEVGWTLKPYINLIGMNRDTCWLKGELPDNATSSDVENTSTIWVNDTNKIENLKITAKNMRYAVHDESSGVRKNWTRNIKNCYIEHYGNSIGSWVSQCAYGSGVSSGSKLIAEDTVFKSPFFPFSTHNNANFTKPCEIILRRCKLLNTNGLYDGSLRIQSLGSGTDDKFILEGCQLNEGISHNDNPWLGDAEATTHIDFKIEGFGNSKVPYGSSFTTGEINRPNFTDEYNNFVAQSNIIKGQVVCFISNYKTVKPMSSGDDVTLFAGIAIEDIASGSIGKVKTKGYVDKTDLYNFTETIVFGTKYGANIDSSLTSNSNAIAIGIDSNNIKII